MTASETNIDIVAWQAVERHVVDWDPLCVALGIRRTAVRSEVYSILLMQGRLNVDAFTTLLRNERSNLSGSVRDLDGLIGELKTSVVMPALGTFHPVRDKIGGGGLEELEFRMKIERLVTDWSPFCFHFGVSASLQGIYFWQMLAQRGRKYSEVLAFLEAMGMEEAARLLREYLTA